MTFLAAAALVGALFTPAPFASEYVALGDSYASGVGAGGTSGSCRRTDAAYPALYAKQQGIAAFRFAACTGATTTDVVGEQLTSLTPATTLVTITVGGNDLGFTDVMTTCTLGSDRSCLARVEEANATVRDVLPERLDATYARIRQLAPGARLVVVGYPRLFEPGTCGVLSPAKRTALNAAADQLAGMTRGRAAAAGAVFVDGRTAFGGHGICAREPWIHALTSPTANSYHPNRRGQAGYLRALTAAGV